MGRKHDKKHPDKISYAGDRENAEQARSASRSERQDHHEGQNENPPRTTSSGWFTTPKFGGATSGGGEIEPGPERD